MKKSIKNLQNEGKSVKLNGKQLSKVVGGNNGHLKGGIAASHEIIFQIEIRN